MDYLQSRHHCIWLQTHRIREDTVVSSVFQLGVSMPSTTVSSLLLFGFGTNCRLLSLCPLPPRPSSLDWWTSWRLRRQFRDIHPVFICTLQHVFLCLRTLDLSVASCTSCTSAVRDITQLWGMCIIGRRVRDREIVLPISYYMGAFLLVGISINIIWLHSVLITVTVIATDVQLY